MYSQFDIDRVVEATNLVELVGEDIDLKPDTGGGFKAHCPFHEGDRTPSLKVSNVKGCYKCFGCNAQGNALKWLTEYRHMTFPKAVEYLADRNGIDLPNRKAKKVAATQHRPKMTYQRPEQWFHPREYVIESMHRQDGPFVRWLKSLPWDDARDVHNVLQMYAVGTTNDGWTMWWYIDHERRMCRCKLMRYDEAGKRTKEGYRMDWLHSKFEKLHKVPKDTYGKHYFGCWFGEHLIPCFPDAEINIVEGEKAAVIMAIANGGVTKMSEKIWLAPGGMQGISREMMDYLVSLPNQINIHPDANAYDEWQRKFEPYLNDHIHINPFTLENQTDPKCGIDDIILMRLIKANDPRQKLESMETKNEALRTLVDKLQLTPIR